jgi:hypothetical protein
LPFRQTFRLKVFILVSPVSCVLHAFILFDLITMAVFGEGAYCLEYELDDRETSIGKGLVTSPSVRTDNGARSTSNWVDKADYLLGGRATATRSLPLTAICFCG